MKFKKISLFSLINTSIMLVLMFVMLYPFLYIINISLSSQVYVLQNSVFFWPKGFTLEWYQRVIADPRIILGYKNTVIYVLLGTAIALVITSMGAYSLSKRKMIFRRQIMLLMVFTILFSGGMIPSYLVAKELHILNTIWAMVLPGAVSTFNLIIFRTFFEGIPEELEDAGKIDGLNEIGIFLRIVIPLSKPVYAAIGLFVAVGIWNDFYTPLIYIRNEALYPLQVILRNLVIAGQIEIQAAAQRAGGGGDTVVESLKFATIIVGTLPILLVYPFLQKYFVQGVMIGSVKG